MGAFDSAAGMSASGLHLAFAAVTVGVALGWAGWVVLRTFKRVNDGRLSQFSLLQAGLTAFGIVVVLAALVALL